MYLSNLRHRKVNGFMSKYINQRNMHRHWLARFIYRENIELDLFYSTRLTWKFFIRESLAGYNSKITALIWITLDAFMDKNVSSQIVLYLYQVLLYPFFHRRSLDAFYLNKFPFAKEQECYLGNMRKSNVSVFFFSSTNCPVLWATIPSKLLVYFSNLWIILSMMLNFLKSTNSRMVPCSESITAIFFWTQNY